MRSSRAAGVRGNGAMVGASSPVRLTGRNVACAIRANVRRMSRWTPPPADTLRLMLVGDLMTGRGIDRILRWPLPAPPGLGAREARRQLREAERANGPVPLRSGPDYVWGDALDAMAQLDAPLRLASLGTAITSATTAWAGKDTHLRMNPRHVDCLAAGGITACALASDHLLDWDYPGLRETLAALSEAGIAGAGAGLDAASALSPAIMATGPGARLLLFSWATPAAGIPAGWGATSTRPGIALLPGLGEADAREVKACVECHRKPGDLVVVSLHWGEREAADVSAAQRAFAHRLVDLGIVDVLHGHGARAPLPFEVYGDRLLLYACGDLIDDEEAMPVAEGQRADLGCLYVATLARRDGRVRMLEIQPLRRRRFRLERADAEAWIWLGRRLGLPSEDRGAGDDAPEIPWCLRWDA